MSHFETVHEETRHGFDIALAITPETDAPDWDFESDEERAETLRKIDGGALLWFVARVTASRAGTVLGTDYLGGCCYESVAEFMAPGGYYPDMVDAAIAEARAQLVRLPPETPNDREALRLQMEHATQMEALASWRERGVL